MRVAGKGRGGRKWHRWAFERVSRTADDLQAHVSLNIVERSSGLTPRILGQPIRPDNATPLSQRRLAWSKNTGSC
jgi:hypothetical protein